MSAWTSRRRSTRYLYVDKDDNPTCNSALDPGTQGGQLHTYALYWRAIPSEREGVRISISNVYVLCLIFENRD